MQLSATGSSSALSPQRARPVVIRLHLSLGHRYLQPADYSRPGLGRIFSSLLLSMFFAGSRFMASPNYEEKKKKRKIYPNDLSSFAIRGARLRTEHDRIKRLLTQKDGGFQGTRVVRIH